MIITTIMKYMNKYTVADACIFHNLVSIVTLPKYCDVCPLLGRNYKTNTIYHFAA